MKNISNNFKELSKYFLEKPIASFASTNLCMYGANTLENLYLVIKDTSFLFVKSWIYKWYIKGTFH